MNYINCGRYLLSCGYKGSNNSVGLVMKGEDKRYRQESELKQQSENVFNMATALQRFLPCDLRAHTLLTKIA